jgi:hypothetical protein
MKDVFLLLLKGAILWKNKVNKKSFGRLLDGDSWDPLDLPWV